MADIIKLDELNVEKDVAVEIERTEEFYDAASVLSDYLSKLSLPNSQHNELVGLILKQVEVAEQGACKFGFRMGLELAIAENNTKKQ